MRVAIYVRVSTRDKGQDTENQLRQLRTWCKRHDHLVTKVYEDRESGKKGRAERKAFDRLFRDAHQRSFDLVLFWSLDRFTREGTVQTIHYLRLLDEYGIGFHSYTEEYLTTDSELVRDLLLTILSHFAKLESERISERTKAGLERAKASGKQLGRPSKVDIALPVVRELVAQTRLDGELTRREMAAKVKEQTGTTVSPKTISRCKRRLREERSRGA